MFELTDNNPDKSASFKMELKTKNFLISGDKLGDKADVCYFGIFRSMDLD